MYRGTACAHTHTFSALSLQLAVVQDAIENASVLNRTREIWVNTVNYQAGDAMAVGAYRTITEFVTLDQRLNWFSFLPVLREAGLLYKSEVGRCSTEAPILGAFDTQKSTA